MSRQEREISIICDWIDWAGRRSEETRGTGSEGDDVTVNYKGRWYSEILDGETKATIRSLQAVPVVVDTVSISEQTSSYALLYFCSVRALPPFHPRTRQGLGYLGVSAGEL